MASGRIRQEKTKTKEDSPPTPEAKANREKVEKLHTDMDELLDEIDLVLEKNAEEFVNAYQQKGGE